jgi:hypothetical protein
LNNIADHFIAEHCASHIFGNLRGGEEISDDLLSDFFLLPSWWRERGVASVGGMNPEMVRSSISESMDSLPPRHSSRRSSTSSSSSSLPHLSSSTPHSYSSSATTRSRFSSSPSASSTSSKPWKKVLYERQPYPDNYVDSDKFLSELDMNSTSQPLTFYGIFLNTAVIIQQITALVIFLLIHRLIQQPNEVINSYYLFFLNCCLLFLIYLISILCHETILISLKSLVLFLICLRIIAPILQTLTSSYSDDTINALVIIFSTIHLVFHDYAYVNNTKENFSGQHSASLLPFCNFSLSSPPPPCRECESECCHVHGSFTRLKIT